MILKIYAVKVGKIPGIYRKWMQAYEQIQGVKGAQFRSFPYVSEYEDADESDERSLAHAMKLAQLYLEEEVIDENVDDQVDEEEDEEDYVDVPVDLPFGMDDEDEDDDTSNENSMQMQKEMVYGGSSFMTKEDEAIQERKKRDAKNNELFELLQIENPRNGNTPWLELLLQEIGHDKPLFSNDVFTGRYSCTSMYVALLYFVLKPEEVWKRFFLHNIEKTFLERRLKSDFLNSEEYATLKRRFSECAAMDLGEIRYRNMDLSDQQAKSRLVMEPETYKALKAFIKEGNHTLVDVYEELIQNKIYREELLTVTGPYHNPHLKALEEEKEAINSIQELVMQAGGISIELKKALIGQPEAINKLESAFFHKEKEARIGKKKRGPRNVFLFAGPPGVGKTFAAQLFAENMGIPYKRFDMAGYAGKDSVEEIAGISNFWKSSKPGVLTGFVKKNPKCVLLFDEIEKANATVIRLFLQVLDEGKCFDRYYDTDISFEDVIMIFTTNAGKQLYLEQTKENLTLLADSVVSDALRKDINPETNSPYFPPEIVSRLSSHTIIMFNHLKADAIRKVVQKDIIKHLDATEKTYGYDLKTGSDVLAATIQFSASGSADARNATKMAGKVIDRELYDFWALVEEKIGLDNAKAVKKIEWSCDFTTATDEIKQFYQGEKDAVIAVFGKEKPVSCKIFEENNITVKFTLDKEELWQMLQKEHVMLVMLDYAYGINPEDKGLSIADINTIGHEVYDRIKIENGDVPVYITYEEMGYHYTAREKQELCNDGIVAFVNYDELKENLENAYLDECCKNTMETLSLRHQILTYETRNEVDIKNELGRIVFYNFKLETAVDAEDKSTLISDDLRPNKKWSDIYVSDDVKEELIYFIDYMKNPNAYKKKGVRVPKGVLMYGPPGTGKTSLAKVVAAESNVNFLSVSADELLQSGPAYVHHQFRVARKYAPAIFFIDEIDAIGANRGSTGVNSALNALLTEMDGFKTQESKPVFIMAATNLGNAIDPALARRFDRTFFVDLPDADGRKWMLEKMLKKHESMFDISDDELTSIAERSTGMSLAALENIIETALRESIRLNCSVDDAMLDEVFEKCLFGEAREAESQDEIRNTAYHEAGHAMIYMYYGKKPNYMSVVARGDFGGYVLNTEKEHSPNKEKYLQRICAALGGRAAEMEFGYGITPGASADLKTATKIATKMVCELGMYEEEVGLAVVTEENLYRHPTAQKQINQILSEQLAEARRIIAEKREIMKKMVDAVLNNEQKYLTQKELLEIYHGTTGEVS